MNLCSTGAQGAGQNCKGLTIFQKTKAHLKEKTLFQKKPFYQSCKFYFPDVLLPGRGKNCQIVLIFI